MHPGLVQNNTDILPGTPECECVLEVSPCTHDEVFGDVCAFCGSRVSNEAEVASNHATPRAPAAKPASTDAREKVYAARGFAVTITPHRARM